MARLSAPTKSDLSIEQRSVFDRIASGPRKSVAGPLLYWLHSPELADRAQALGAYCRFGTSLPPRLSELAIVTMGALWRAGVEWHAHAPLAAKEGISRDALDTIHRGETPVFEKDDEAVVHAFTTELVQNRNVSQPTFTRALSAFGNNGVVDLVGILGYYTLISMSIKAFEIPVPNGDPEPFADR